MSTHTEVTTVEYASVDIYQPGDAIGYEDVPSGQYALRLGDIGTQMFVLGTREELFELTSQIQALLHPLPYNAPQVREVRAGNIHMPDQPKPTHIRYPGEEWIKVESIGYHGDTVLVTGDDGEQSYDTDEVVEVLVPAPQPEPSR